MMQSKHLTEFLLIICCWCCCLTKCDKPNIVVIVADDLGWNDVSYHGSDQIPTPNIDKLAKEGIILNNYYAQPLCTPSRAAFMTGRYPIHTGMQVGVIGGPNGWGLGLNETLLPELLKEQGYATHGIGKWHIGNYAKEFTPTHRGFDSYYGYYLGEGDYWDHSSKQFRIWGLDLHSNEKPVFTQWGNYSTKMFTMEAEDRINNHNKSQPLFLYLAYKAVHSANTQDPIQAPKHWIERFSYIKHEGRRRFAGVLGCLDHSIGRVYNALVKKGMMDNTILVFTSDNGGPANGFDLNWASNYPLRGLKTYLWEGGIRVPAFAYSKLFQKQQRTSMDLIHITDWFPTLLKAAGGTPKDNLDGFDQWDTLSNGAPSPRKEILLNIDDLMYKQQALRSGDWKIIQDATEYDGWYPPPEITKTKIKSSNANGYIQFNAAHSIVDCGEKPENVSSCKPPKFCVFNLKDDPCEYHDLSEKRPDILKYLMEKLNGYRASMVPSRHNFTIDPLANPKLHNGVWEPWKNP